MCNQEQEHWDYETGAARNDLQLDLQVSQQEWRQNPHRGEEAKRIHQLRADGKFVVVSEEPVYCPRTDAIMGSQTILIASADTHDEADKLACEAAESDPECRVSVKPPL